MFGIRLKDLILIPNIISILRFLLVIPFGILLVGTDTNSKIITLIISGVIILTDFLDGFLARKLNQKSELGKVLDPLADKVVFISVAVLFVIFKSLPLWIMIYIIARDLAVFLVGMVLSKKEGQVLQSNIWGKISTTLLALAFLSVIIFGINSIPTASLFLLGLLMFTFATIGYIIHFIIPVGDTKKKKTIMIIAFIIFWTLALVYIGLGVFGYIIMPDPFFAITYYS